MDKLCFTAGLHRLAALTDRPARWAIPLFALPPVLGLLAKLHHSKYWFGDYEAVACAGRKVIAHAPIYALNLQCDGMHASSFVYIPVVAHVAAFLQRSLSEPGFFALYLAFYIAAIAALTVVPFAARAIPGTWRDKLPFAALLTGSAFMWGNIAVILHAGVLAGALALEVTPWLFIAAVVAAAWVKPVFLTYLIVILIADLPIHKRLILTVSGMAAGLLPTLLFALNGGALADQWYALLSHFVYNVTPGVGFFGWLHLSGLEPADALVKACYLVYAGLIALSGLALAEGLHLNRQERLWLGLSLGVLLIPRLMSQDVFLLGPGLLVVAEKSAQVLHRHDRSWLRHGSSIVLGLCGLAAAGGLTGLGNYSRPLALLGFSLYILWLGQNLLSLRARRIFAPFRAAFRPHTGKTGYPAE